MPLGYRNQERILRLGLSRNWGCVYMQIVMGFDAGLPFLIIKLSDACYGL